MGINFNMNLISLILYCCGIVSILLSFLFIVLAMKKNTKVSYTLVIIMFFLSIVLLVSGTFAKLIHNKRNPTKEESVQSANIENNSSTNNSEAVEPKESSYDDLKFSYKLGSSHSDSKKSANITMKNSSDSVFSGEVTVDFTDSNNQNLDTLTLQIQNLLPKKSYSSHALVNNNVSNINYTFSGEFNNYESTQIPYSISKISTGNNFVRINVSVNNTSQSHLEQICNAIAAKYTKSDFDGMLIYFYPENVSDDLNFENAIADYYLNIKSKTSKFTYY